MFVKVGLEIQSATYHHPPIGVVLATVTGIDKGVETLEAMCWWERAVGQPLWKTVRWVLRKSNSNST